LLICSCLSAALVGCHFPCCQFGITEKALGHNCIVGCCFAAYCTHCAAYTQRRHIKKGDLLTDLLLACCCPHCVIMQNANQVGVRCAALRLHAAAACRRVLPVALTLLPPSARAAP
jgi:hypothetical protein